MEDSASGALGKLAGRVVRWANAAAVSLVIALVAVFAYEIVARYLFGKPTGFANQLAAYSVPLIAFLAAGKTLAEDGHVTVDILVQALDAKARARLAIVIEGLCVLLLLVVTWITVRVVVASWETDYKAFSTAFAFPEYLPQIAMPVGLALLTVQQVRQFVRSIRQHTGATSK